MAGHFITFEGGEGAGKSTQIKRLAGRLRRRGLDVVTTREPGGTPLGGRIRRILLDPASEIDPTAEVLLYAADRAHHVASVITPALDAGKVVLCDRYIDSTYAYQGGGRQVSLDDLQTITSFAIGGVLPDLTILLDIDPAVGLARARGRSASDRIESEAMSFHVAVRERFRELAIDRSRYVVIDASADPMAIAQQVWSAVEELVR